VRNDGVDSAPVTLHLATAEHFWFTSARRYRWGADERDLTRVRLGPSERKTYRVAIEITTNPRRWRAPPEWSAAIPIADVFCALSLGFACEVDRSGFSACDGRRPFCFDALAVVNRYGAATEDRRHRLNNALIRRGVTIRPGRATLVGSGG
jgi:hypothetical protein